MFTRSRSAWLLALAGSTVLLLPVGTSASGLGSATQHGPRVALPGPVHYARTALAAAPPATSMIYHGGPVLMGATIYLDFWGSEWANGFQGCSVPVPLLGQLAGPCYSANQVMSYAIGLVSSWGGSPWRNTDTQYCQGAAHGAVDCGPGLARISDPNNQFGGSWIDAAPVPGTPGQQDIANEAQNALRHFHTGALTDPNGLYFVFTPPGKLVPGSGTDFCGYHSAYTYSDGSVAFSFAYQPYIFNQPSCGRNFVNSSNDSFGHGYMDGLSMVMGHEVAEAETDPGAGSAWTDQSGGSGEVGDKCNFDPASRNVTFGNNYYAMQPLWSNADPGANPGGSCAMSSASTLDQAERFINNAFVDILGRPADPGGLDFYSHQVFAGRSRSDIATMLDKSPEYLTHVAGGLYQRYLGRQGDSGGINFWVNGLAKGTATDESEAVSFIASDEYFNNHGGNNTSYVNGIYNDALGRAPDAGASFWINRLDAGAKRTDAAAAFLYTDEFKADIVNGYYQTFLGRNSDSTGLRFWVSQLQHGVSDESLISLLVSSPEYFYK
jgi:hypothetical protein